MQLEIADVTDFDSVVARLTEHERRLAASKPLKETAFQATTGQGGAGRGRGRGKGKGRGGRPQNQFPDVVCYHCEKPGHYRSDCNDRKKEQAGGRGGPSTGPLAAPGGGKGLSPQSQEAHMASETSWIAIARCDENATAN